MVHNFVTYRSVLPISQEYENAGEFTFKQKMVRSLRVNLLLYGIGAGLGIIIVLIMIIRKQLTSFADLLAICVVLSNGL
jgi:hypothetical protein